MYAVVDARVSYTYNLEVCVGCQNEGTNQISNKPVNVVKRLANPVRGSGRNVACVRIEKYETLNCWHTKEK